METFKSESLGISTTVNQLTDGRFSVVLKDDDSGNYFPTIKIYKEKDDAILEAKRIIKDWQ